MHLSGVTHVMVRIVVVVVVGVIIIVGVVVAVSVIAIHRSFMCDLVCSFRPGAHFIIHVPAVSLRRMVHKRGE